MQVKELLSDIFRNDFRRLFATLVRLVGDFDNAEDMLQEAFVVATQKWPYEGIPANPQAWLISVARHKALDRLRREQRFEGLDEEHLKLEAAQYEPDFTDEWTDGSIEDDRLRLIFTCCHPALDLQVQVALTLREVCGLSTDAIATAFLVQTSTLAQRLVRGKAKIKTAGIPYATPEAEQLPERLDAVLAVIYLVYNAGYRVPAPGSPSSPDSQTVPLLAVEALRLARLLVLLLPQVETLGLLALMLLNEARRPARLSPAGELVLLEDQDRSLWRQDYIEEGLRVLEHAGTLGPAGAYTLQAAIAAQHALATSAAETHWDRIVLLYDLLLQNTASPVVALNRAVAVSMRDGPQAGLELIEILLNNKILDAYHPLHVAHAELSRRVGAKEEARQSYQRALALVQQDVERRHLLARLASL